MRGNDDVPMRVLVVEDDAAVRRLVSEVLADSGHDVTEAGDGAAALRFLDPDRPFDLVVLDMRLPLIDGWAFAEQMRARGMDIPLLVMTAGRDARRAAEDVRAVGYVGKPFDIDELERAVRTALGGGREGRLLRAACIPALPAIFRGARRTRHPAIAAEPAPRVLCVRACRPGALLSLRAHAVMVGRV
jgi:CheY-like chemotaxis protein